MFPYVIKGTRAKKLKSIDHQGNNYIIDELWKKAKQFESTHKNAYGIPKGYLKGVLV